MAPHRTTGANPLRAPSVWWRALIFTSPFALGACSGQPSTQDAARDAGASEASSDGAMGDAPTPPDDAPASDALPPDDGGDSGGGGDGGAPLVRYTEMREPCTSRSALRNVYYGDLHVHTSFSFDAYGFGTRGTPADAYRYARGMPATLTGGRMVQLARPLDFTAVTDHSEWLGEVHMCTVMGSPGYNSPACMAYRTGGGNIQQAQTAECASGMVDCRAQTQVAWRAEQAAAEAAYDRTAACRFTALIAYEFTGVYRGSWAHRNVIFRNDHVPDVPVSQRDVTDPTGLWTQLAARCLDAGMGCEVLAIPHNMNYTAGNEFALDYPMGATMVEQRTRAALRARLEPLAEIWQNKGASECYDNPMFGSPDELCRTGDLVPDGTPLCGGDGTGRGMMNFGCVSRVDYMRGILAAGIAEDQRIGVNPFHLGIIADTDTHNAIPSGTPPSNFQGNHGDGDATPRQRLAGDYPRHSTGGLTGVWAVENSRDALFEALARRETFGTSGPRIAVRFFGGWSYPDALCADPTLIQRGYDGGVAMGGTLPARPATAMAPTFIVQALRDETPLQRVQIVKGWVDAMGVTHDQVFDVAGSASNGATVDLATCTPHGAGSDMLCTVWRDPAFDPSVRAFYYARVLENPTCHWSQYQCNDFPAGMRPAGCADPTRERTIQQRAWSSPIWYSPP